MTISRRTLPGDHRWRGRRRRGRGGGGSGWSGTTWSRSRSAGPRRPAAASDRTARHSANDERILVVVNLGGGNDGLNTLVPAGVGAYHDARPTLGVAESSLVALAGTTAYGLNPALAPLQKWWEAKHLVAVDGMAIPEPDPVALPGQRRVVVGRARPIPDGTGWLGRWLDTDPTPPTRCAPSPWGSTTAPSPVDAPWPPRWSTPRLRAAHPQGVRRRPDLTRPSWPRLVPARPTRCEAASQQAIPDAVALGDTLPRC